MPKSPGKSPFSKGKQHRFKPGESGNPKGRPLGSKSFKAAYDAISSLLAGEVTFPGGITRFLTGYEKIALQAFSKAVHGDLKAAEMIADRKEGKPVQPQLQLGDEKRSLRIVVDHRQSLDPSPNEEGSDGKKEEE